MTCYEAISVIVSGIVCFAVIMQTVIARRIKEFTKQQMQINRVNLWTAFMSAEAGFVSQVLSQSLEQIKVAREQGEEVSTELLEFGKTVQDWVGKFRIRLDTLEQHLPLLDTKPMYKRPDDPHT